MRRSLLALCVALTVAGLMPAHAAEAKVVQISNFRFCPDRPFACDPADQSYVADSSSNGAPLVAQYNPIPVTTVHVGDTIRFYYADALCDAISGCPGHEVRFVGDSSPTATFGARSEAAAVTFTVPAGWAPGYHPYRCTLNAHYSFGMTGVVNVV